MALKIIAPNAASTYTTAGSLTNTASAPTWVGMSTPLTSSGCVTFYRGASPVAGSAFLVVNASPGRVEMHGPYYFSDGISTSSISGGSVLVWLQL